MSDVNAKCNCAPDGWTIECGLPCKCRCHELEAQVYALRKVLEDLQDDARFREFCPGYIEDIVRALARPGVTP